MQPDTIEWHGSELMCYKTINIDKLNELFLDYINYGGYPEVVFSERIRENPAQYWNYAPKTLCLQSIIILSYEIY